jgi:uncharacterized protein YcbK (DUF882 family)
LQELREKAIIQDDKSEYLMEPHEKVEINAPGELIYKPVKTAGSDRWGECRNDDQRKTRHRQGYHLMITRRNFLKALVVASVLYPYGKVLAANTVEKSLNLYNIHTDESLDITYYSAGRYDFEALGKINHLLRCHYNNEVKPIDIGVLDLLNDVKTRVGADKEIQIISGYRSPEYNDYLRSIGRNVAKNSYHLRGVAIDFSIQGFSMSALSHVAKSFLAGGVGQYADFVHIDTGPVRYW